MNGPQANLLPDGRRLHLNHGPIDLIIEAFGEAAEVRAAYSQATARFQTILTELVEELPALRSAASPTPRAFRGPTARRMEAAVSPLAGENFITPMAAVAGSVADEILAAMLAGRTARPSLCQQWRRQRAASRAGPVDAAGDRRERATVLPTASSIRAEDAVRGVATSGWRGRSFSLGIADAVTVLARNGAEADAAATIIANAVDLPGHPAIRREKARTLAPDSDLGDRLVTTGVGALTAGEVARRWTAGLPRPRSCAKGLIEAAALFLNGECQGLRRTSLSLGGQSRARAEMGVRADRRLPVGWRRPQR